MRWLLGGLVVLLLGCSELTSPCLREYGVLWMAAGDTLPYATIELLDANGVPIDTIMIQCIPP